MGFLGSIGAGLRNALGGEVAQVTNIIHEGRLQSYDRMVKEATELGGIGITGVTSELKRFHGNIEFLSVASCIHHEGASTKKSNSPPAATAKNYIANSTPATRP